MNFIKTVGEAIEAVILSLRPGGQDAQPQDSQPQDAQPQDSQPQDAQPQDSQPQDAQPQDSQPQDAQPQDSQPQDAQPQDSQPQDAQPQDSQPQDAQPQDSQPQDSQNHLIGRKSSSYCGHKENKITKKWLIAAKKGSNHKYFKIKTNLILELLK